jgi:hypothetical protein
MKLVAVSALLIIGSSLVAAPSAAARTRQYVVAIGNNAPPAGEGAESDSPPLLHFADDDAASLAELGSEIGASSTLLTVFDADSQRRFPRLAGSALPPTLAALRTVVDSLRASIEEDKRRGDDSAVVLFYSGHGTIKADEPPSLAMLDGPLTQTILYDEVLAELPARYVHLVIDACHAEAVVRPRDGQATPAAVPQATLEEYLSRSTLRRFPNVGALVAATSDAEAHEWDRYQRGIFTYQVLSGLSGGADINGDGRVEYSELSAFITAANAAVEDPQAKVSFVVHPPAVNPRAPLLDLKIHRQGAAILAGVGPGIGRFFVEDQRGNRLSELRPEPEFRFSLLLPSGVLLYVRTADEEASFELAPGTTLALGSLQMRRQTTRPRGAADDSLRRGLFYVAFGPRYYQGFVDARADLVPVGRLDVVATPARPRVDAVIATAGSPDPPPQALRDVAWMIGGLGVAGLAAGTAFSFELAAKNHESDQICPPGNPCQMGDVVRYNGFVAEARTAKTRAIYSFAAGGAALLGAGIVLFSTWPSMSETKISALASPGLAAATFETAW